MEEARRILERLERIERLRAADGGRRALLGEVRGLLADGEAWLAAEPAGTGRARELLEACGRQLAEPGEEAAAARA